MKHMEGKLLRLFVLSLLLVGVVACGSDDDDDDDSTPVVMEQEQEADGVFYADLQPANPLVAGAAKGLATLKLSGDDLHVNVLMDDGPSGMHMQHIHLGTAYATMANDTSADGYLDAAEATPVTGPMLVPFDGDLSSQMEGHHDFPSGRRFSYLESTSFTELLTDLWQPDEDPTDAMVKLTPNEMLRLEGKVIEVHGVSSSVDLPETVGSIDGKPAHETLPILCGVITRALGDGTGTGSEDGTGSETTGTSTGGTTPPTGTGGSIDTLKEIRAEANASAFSVLSYSIR